MEADNDYALSLTMSFHWTARTPSRDDIFPKKRRGSNLTVTRTHKHSAISSVTVCRIMLSVAVMSVAVMLIKLVLIPYGLALCSMHFKMQEFDVVCG